MRSSLKCGLRQLNSNLWQLAAWMLPFIIWSLRSVGILITDAVSIYSVINIEQSPFCFHSSIRYPKGLLPSTRRGQKSVLRPGRPPGGSATNSAASPSGILSMRCPVRWGLDPALKSLPANLLKMIVSRDFLLLVLFMNQFPPSPRVFH